MTARPQHWRLNRLEVAGAFGDLGTLLPLALGMIVVNGLAATNVLICFGLFYVIAGLYFRVTVPVQPMKAIGAYAIATGLTAPQIAAAGAWMAAILLVLGASGLIQLIRRFVPASTIRGVQLAVGVVLVKKGIALMIDLDPGLSFQTVGPLSIGLLIGAGGFVITLLLLDNPKLPAALVVLGLGLVLGLAIGTPLDTSQLTIGLHLPTPFPAGVPSWDDILWVLPAVVLPQLPMTLGNAVISVDDLTHEYFPEQAKRVSVRSLALSQALGNAGSFALGGIPMCHGAGGLAAHYRFGARTAVANLIIGGLLVALALVFGESIVTVLGVLPQAILGVLLVFAGLQLAITVSDLDQRADYFVAFTMLALGLAFNLAIAFGVGIALAYLLKLRWIKL